MEPVVRIVIDFGLRALSPAINDPTTAVLALGQLHRMLRMVGLRHLRTDELLDESKGDLPDAELGGFRPSRILRNSQMRLKQPTGRAAFACHDREPSGNVASASTCALHKLRMLDRNNRQSLSLSRRAGLGPDR
jgi:hypothetical protein